MAKEQLNLIDELFNRYDSNSVMSKLFKEGIASGDYSVKLNDVKQAETKKGDPIVRFIYELTEPYSFEDKLIENVHISTTFTDTVKEDRNGNKINYAQDQLALAIIDLALINKMDKEETIKLISDKSTEELVDELKNLMVSTDEKELDRQQTAYIKTTKLPSINNEGEFAIFYAVYINR